MESPRAGDGAAEFPAPPAARAISLFSPGLEWLISLTEEEFRDVFRGSPVKRAKWRGLVRNACVAIGNSGLRAGEPRYAGPCAKLFPVATGE